MTTTYFTDNDGLQPPLATPKIILMVGAHPDDIEFGCGGSLAKWADLGARLIYVILTDGSKGTWDVTVDPLNLAEIRQEEQLEAARAISDGSLVEFLGCTDGELKYETEQVAQVCALIRKHKPDLLIGHDPWKRYRLHPDHRNAGFIIIDALVAARDPLFHRQLGPNHRPKALLLFEADEPNYFEQLSETNLVKKAESLLKHRSQHISSMEMANESESTIADFAQKVFSAGRSIGAKYDCEFAEHFRLISDI